MKTTLCALVLAIGLVLPALSQEIGVSYLGHSCFTLQATDGPIVMIDPYGTYVPYPGLPKPADVVLMTHGHIDHCPPCYGEMDRWEGDPVVIWPFDDEGRVNEGDWRIEDYVVRFIEASHGTYGGQDLGLVCAFSFEIEGVRFAHLGDLGTPLTTAQIQALGDVDVLFVPVGGAYTIDAAEALTVIAQLPTVKVVFPIHYYVDGYCPWAEMAPLDDFTRVASGLYPIRDLGASATTVSAETLPDETEVWVLEFATD